MLRLLIDRIMFSVATLLGVGLVLFVLTRSIAGSPATIVLGTEATPEQIRQFNHDHGLDLPVIVQYWHWLRDIVGRLDFGTSLLTGQKVAPTVLAGFPITFEIVGLAFLFAVAVALPLGIVSAGAARRGRRAGWNRPNRWNSCGRWKRGSALPWR